MKRVLLCLAALGGGCQFVNTGADQEFACKQTTDCAGGLSCCSDGVCRSNCDAAPDAGAVCLAYAAGECMQYETCTDGYEITRDWGDMETCLAREQLHCELFLGVPDTIDHLAQVAACAQDLPGESCEEFWYTESAACQSLAGTLPAGSPCANSSQCASAYCDLPGGKLCGTCAPRALPGQSCASADCAYGYVCLDGPKTCALPGSTGAGCTTQDDCLLGYQCLGPADGGACAPGDQAGVACDPHKLKGPLGCDERLGIYCQGLTDGGGLCTPYGWADAGQPCGDIPGMGFFTQCVQSGTCDGLDGGARPSGAEGICVGYAGDGEECNSYRGCLDPSSCVGAGFCAPLDSQSCGVSTDGG